MQLTEILGALKSYGIPTGVPTVVIAIVIIMCFRYPSVAAKLLLGLLAIIGRGRRFVFRHLKWMGGYFSRKNMAVDIETYLNSSMRKLQLEAPFLAPCGVKVQFVRPLKQEKGELSAEGEVLLVLHPGRPDENLANAVWRFTQLGAIRDGTEYIDPAVKRATDLNVARRVLFGHDRAKRGAYYSFKSGILSPCLSEDDTVREWYEKLHTIDGNGSFSRVYLNEVSELCETLSNSAMSPASIPDEIKRFIDFLWNIHTREKGERSPLRFAGPWIGIQILLVGEGAKLARREIWRYLEAMRHGVESGDIKTIYVSAFTDPDKRITYPRTDPIATAQRVANEAVRRWRNVTRISKTDQLYRGIVRDQSKVLICIPLQVTAEK